MRFFLLVLLALAASTTIPRAIEDHDLKHEFELYKIEFNRRYANEKEEEMRFQLFSQKFMKIIGFNTNPENRSVHGVYLWMDRTEEELQRIFPVRSLSTRDRRAAEINFNTFKSKVRASFDSSLVTVDKRNLMTPIKYQDQCGSCYIFSATALVEAAFSFSLGTPTQFSEQDVLDCMSSATCNGGSSNVVITDYFSKEGVVLTKDYSYTAVKGTCKTATRYHKGLFQPVIVSRPISTNQDAKWFLQQVGALGGHMYADDKVMSYRKNGLLFCDSVYSSTNHAVTIVGYTVVEKKEAWIIRNSWDTWWGDKGYMYLQLGSCATDIYSAESAIFNRCSSYNNKVDCEKNPHCQFCSGTTCVLITATCPATECTSGDCCTPDGKLRPASYTCYTKVEKCDNDVKCTGSSPTCPTTGKFQSQFTVCRPAAGECDVAETCTGNSAFCPTDKFMAPGTVCRPAAGECDVAETCTGTAKCPEDAFQPKTVVCRPAVSSECDEPEYCTGSSASCPEDVVKTGVCRKAVAQCENDVMCVAGSCPSMSFKSVGTPCNDGDPCSTDDRCTSTGACRGRNTKCKCTSDSDCDDLNPCTVHKCNPDLECEYTASEGDSIICRDKADECDYVEYCRGSVCPEDLKNQTCVDELTARTHTAKEHDGPGFSWYYIVIVVVAVVVFVAVIAFVAYRVRKNTKQKQKGKSKREPHQSANCAN